jgi:hypothetical protein
MVSKNKVKAVIKASHELGPPGESGFAALHGLQPAQAGHFFGRQSVYLEFSQGAVRAS